MQSRLASKATLLCPRCRTGLTVEPVLESAGLRCASCDSHYRIENGIADLLGDVVLEGEDAPETDYYSPMRRRADSLTVLVMDGLFAAIRDTLAERATELGRGLDVVDIGSGNLLRGTGASGGRMFTILQDHARSYVGIEPSWAMLRDVNDLPDGHIRHLSEARLIRSTGEDLPVADESADAVLCLSVLDHCVDPALVARRVQTALRRGGRFILTLQNPDRWYRKLLRTVAPGVDARHAAHDHHHHTFTPDAAETLLRDTGLDVIVRREFGHLLAPKLRDALGLALSPFERLAREPAGRAVAAAESLLAKVVPGVGMFYLMVATKS